MTMTYQIKLVEQRLSDGSCVTNVEIGNVVLHAMSDSDAEELVLALMALIERHTTDDACPAWFGAGPV
jgi:hypothetical protein